MDNAKNRIGYKASRCAKNVQLFLKTASSAWLKQKEVLMINLFVKTVGMQFRDNVKSATNLLESPANLCAENAKQLRINKVKSQWNALLVIKVVDLPSFNVMTAPSNKIKRKSVNCAQNTTF